MPSFGKPSCKFVNVVFGKQAGVVLLESPVGSGFISRPQLAEEISTVFGIDPTRKRQIFADASFKEEICDNVASLDKKTVYVRHGDASRATLTCDEGSVCPFVDVEHGGKKATILLENPVGFSVCNYASQVLKLEACPKGIALGIKHSPVTQSSSELLLHEIGPGSLSIAMLMTLLTYFQVARGIFKLKSLAFKLENNNSNLAPVQLEKLTLKQAQVLNGKTLFVA